MAERYGTVLYHLIPCCDILCRICCIHRFPSRPYCAITTRRLHYCCLIKSWTNWWAEILHKLLVMVLRCLFLFCRWMVQWVMQPLQITLLRAAWMLQSRGNTHGLWKRWEILHQVGILRMMLGLVDCSYPCMPIGKVWMYCLILFVCVFLCYCVCVCVFVQLRISPPRMKLAASNFAHELCSHWSPKSKELASARPRPPAC